MVHGLESPPFILLALALFCGCVLGVTKNIPYFEFLDLSGTEEFPLLNTCMWK